MTGRINFSNLVRQLLPAHKRQPVRLWLLRHLTAPMQALFGQFDSWRTDTRRLINVTSQVKVLEGYLRAKYGRIEIRLLSFANLSPAVSLRSEGMTHRLRVAVRPQSFREAVPMRGEIRGIFGDADFVVYIPNDIDREIVRADIERFKQALVTYKIIVE